MSEKKAAIGRPKNEAASKEIKDQAIALVRAQGYANVSISDIIKAAGVSRQTLYNRWASKAELVLEAFFELAGAQVSAPDLGSGIPRRDLLARFLHEVFDHLDSEGDCLRSLIAAAQMDGDFRDIFWARFVSPRADLVTALLKDAQERGDLHASRDVDLLSSFIHGAFWYRLLNGQSIDGSFADAIADDVFRV
ncbi:TetR/AcrR family transcriptional regulator [Thalassospira lucentensis]|uniref:TetR/AcrR family transcriptional regulator n=1 Tax=Thalassospira lucentensis TaxID=168935 RepID=UPI003D2EB937